MEPTLKELAERDQLWDVYRKGLEKTIEVVVPADDSPRRFAVTVVPSYDADKKVDRLILYAAEVRG